jgi:1,6-anhydro-N-acetylmuramate kinase
MRHSVGDAFARLSGQKKEALGLALMGWVHERSVPPACPEAVGSNGTKLEL